jgi:hypothetical protein
LKVDDYFIQVEFSTNIVLIYIFNDNMKDLINIWNQVFYGIDYYTTLLQHFVDSFNTNANMDSNVTILKMWIRFSLNQEQKQN